MREYIVCICFAVIFCAGISILVPGKKYEGIIKIICGIFVISTVVSPIGSFLFYDGADLEFDRYLRDDGSFDYYMTRSRDEFSAALASPDNTITESVLAREIRGLTGGDITVDLADENAYIAGVDSDEENRVTNYLRDTYSINAIFVN